jgi:hypothetical protein
VGGICLKDRGINNKSPSWYIPVIYIYINVMFGTERVPCAGGALGVVTGAENPR